MNIIEHLKDKSKAQPYGLRTPEEQAVLTTAGKKHALYLRGCTNAKWDKPVNDGSPYYEDCTYILNPDYQPEPEFLDIEVVRVEGEIRLKENCPNSQYTYLWWAQCDKDFVGFLTDEGWIAFDRVATTLYGRKKVVARFRKETT